MKPTEQGSSQQNDFLEGVVHYAKRQLPLQGRYFAEQRVELLRWVVWCVKVERGNNCGRGSRKGEMGSGKRETES